MSIKYSIEPKPQCDAFEPRQRSDDLGTCPFPEQMLSLVSGGRGMRFPGGEEIVIGHLLFCHRCRETLSFVVEAEAFRVRSMGTAIRAPFAESSVWSAFARALHRREAVQRFMVNHDIDAFASSGENRIVFRSDAGAPSAIAWRAVIGLPPLEAVTAPLSVRVSSLNRNKPLEGTFTICGIHVDIQRGEGTISRDELVSSLSRGGVSFATTGGASVPGSPIFGSFE